MLEHAVVRIADDQLARVPVGGAQIGDAPGIVEGLAGDWFALIGKRDLPTAMIGSLHAHGDEAGSWHTRSMLRRGYACIRDISHDWSVRRPNRPDR